MKLEDNGVVSLEAEATLPKLQIISRMIETCCTYQCDNAGHTANRDDDLSLDLVTVSVIRAFIKQKSRCIEFVLSE